LFARMHHRTRRHGRHPQKTERITAA
jgi:hypothetical protein